MVLLFSPGRRRMEIVSENGTMTENFEVGKYDPTVVENWENGTGSENEESEARARNLGLGLTSSRFVRTV